MLKNKYFQVIGGFIAIVFGVLQGIDWLFNKYQIDSFYFNMILIFILISFLATLIYYLIKKVNKKSDKVYKYKILFGIVSSFLLLAIFNYYYNRINNNQNNFIKKLMDKHLLTIRAAENVIRILPPLNVKKNEIDKALKIIEKVCSEIK